MEKILENENKVKKHFMSHKWLVVNTDGSKKKGKQEIVSFSRSKKILNEEGKQLPQGHFRFWGTLEHKGSPTIYHLIIKKERKGGWYTFTYQPKKGYWKGASWGYRLQKEDE